MIEQILQHPELESSSFFWEAGSIVNILLHGMTATTAEVRPLAGCIHSQGYTVAARLVPGHGTSPQDLNNQKWQNWVKALEEAYKTLKEKCQMVFVECESMGGLLALMLASNHPDLDGIFLYTPAFRIPGII